MQIYADVLRLPLSVIGSDAGPGARLGDPRRRRRRRLPRRAVRPPSAMGKVRPRRLRAGRVAVAASYDRLYAEYLAAARPLRPRRRRRCAGSRRSVATRSRADGDARRRREPSDDRPSTTSAADDPDRCVARSARCMPQLTRYELVVWTAGNVSARVPGAGPAGDQAERRRLRRADPGEHGRLRPRRPGRRGRARAVVGHRGRRPTSTGTCRDVGGVVHTHSHLRHRLGRPRRADPVRADHDGRRVRRRDPGRPVRASSATTRSAAASSRPCAGSRSPAVLMRNHGVFTIGPTARAAVKAAVMCEDVARTVHIARQLGHADRRSTRPTSTRSTTATRTSTASADPRLPSTHERRRPRMDHAWPAPPRPPPRSGSSPAARVCTGPRPSTRSPTSRGDRRPARRRTGRPGAGGVEAGAARRRRRSTGRCWTPTPPTTCVGVIAWMHTFSPAKMWIAGLDALQKPLLHLHTQANVELPWATIDMDFMNLNQAAHGDREFGYIQTRLGVPRKTVAGHVDSTRRSPAGSAPGRGPRSAAHELRRAAAGPLRRQHARRRGDRGRQGRGAAAVRRLGQHLRRQRPRRRGRRRSPTRTSTSSSTEYDDTYGVAPELLPGGERHESLRYGARIELGLRHVPRPTAASARSPRTSRTSAACGSCPGLAVQRLMADGYGFGGEGDWKTSVLLRDAQGDGRRAARAARRSWRTTPTTWCPGEEKILGAHMLEVCPTITDAHAVPGDPPARHRRPRGPGAAACSPPTRARPWSSGSPTSATGSG